jgi:DNA phosphorothioation-dependent restriction protein DptG
MEENEHFNCNQNHEATYITAVYNDKTDKTIKEFLKEKCRAGKINYLTREKLYALLDANGFTRK